MISRRISTRTQGKKSKDLHLHSILHRFPISLTFTYQAIQIWYFYCGQQQQTLADQSFTENVGYNLCCAWYVCLTCLQWSGFLSLNTTSVLSWPARYHIHSRKLSREKLSWLSWIWHLLWKFSPTKRSRSLLSFIAHVHTLLHYTTCSHQTASNRLTYVYASKHWQVPEHTYSHGHRLYLVIKPVNGRWKSREGLMVRVVSLSCG